MAYVIADNAELVEALKIEGIEVVLPSEFSKVSAEELKQHELFDNINDGETSAFKVYRKGGNGTDKKNGRSFDYIVFYDSENSRPSGMVFRDYFEPTIDDIKEFIASWSN